MIGWKLICFQATLQSNHSTSYVAFHGVSYSSINKVAIIHTIPSVTSTYLGQITSPLNHGRLVLDRLTRWISLPAHLQMPKFLREEGSHEAMDPIWQQVIVQTGTGSEMVLGEFCWLFWRVWHTRFLLHVINTTLCLPWFLVVMVCYNKVRQPPLRQKLVSQTLGSLPGTPTAPVLTRFKPYWPYMRHVVDVTKFPKASLNKHKSVMNRPKSRYVHLRRDTRIS